MKINHQVAVASITTFHRENHHTRRPIIETFVAITMQAEDGQAFITFSRNHSEFASSVKVGDSFRLGGKFKREQTYNGVYGIVVTNCTINKSEPVRKVNKRSIRVLEALGV